MHTPHSEHQTSATLSQQAWHTPLLLCASLLLAGCGQLPSTDIPAPPTPQAHAVVFDIDGTLTPKNLAIFTARADAARAVGLFADKHYHIVYLSARNPLLQGGLPDWLKENNFPSGSLHVVQSFSEHLNPAEYKTGMLKAYRQKGWQIDFAYGDSSTDFEAYAAAGIPVERVFALRREGDEECQPGTWTTCLLGWGEHVERINALPPL